MDQCDRCKHKKQPDGGWCYMFREKPRHVPTYWCAKYEPIDPEEKEYLEDMFAIQKRLFDPPNSTMSGKNDSA